MRGGVLLAGAEGAGVDGVGAVVTGGGGGALTSMRNGGSSAVALPSVTVTTISAVCPASVARGVPNISPDPAFMPAQEGSPVALNRNVSPSLSAARGSNS